MRRSFRNRSAGAPRSGSDREFAFRSSRSVLSPPRYGKRHAPYRGGFERCSSRRARAAGEKARASRPRVVGPMTGLPTCTSYFGRMISARDFCAIPAADGMFGMCGPARTFTASERIQGGDRIVGRRRDWLPEKVFSRSARVPADWPGMPRLRSASDRKYSRPSVLRKRVATFRTNCRRTPCGRKPATGRSLRPRR